MNIRTDYLYYRKIVWQGKEKLEVKEMKRQGIGILAFFSTTRKRVCWIRFMIVMHYWRVMLMTKTTTSKTLTLPTVSLSITATKAMATEQRGLLNPIAKYTLTHFQEFFY